MKLLLLMGLTLLLTPLMSCKKSQANTSEVNATATVSYSVDGVMYQEAFPFTTTNSPYTLPSYLAFPAGVPNNGIFMSFSRNVKSPGDTLYGNIGFYFNYPYPFDSIVTGMYTYAYINPVTAEDSLKVAWEGFLVTDTGNTARYPIMLSDSITITSYQNQLASGTFEATFVNKIGGDSIIHVSDGTFSNIDLAIIRVINPGGPQL
jgi:hypothetical protein